jgi:hypothetical protein
MINSITGNNYIVVNHSYSTTPYVNQNSSNPMQGMLRLNGSDMQVFDGTAWLSISASYPSIGLNGVAESAINWALTKMQEEAEFKKLAETSDAVKHAIEEVNLAKERLKIIATLAKEPDA